MTKAILRVLLVAWLLPASSAFAQTAPARTVGFAEYLKAVDDNSLDLLAQRENVASARAGVSIAGLRPDPVLTAGLASRELYGPNKPSASSGVLTAGVGFTIETAGKRGARIRGAESNVALSQANVEVFQQQLQADAAAAFVEACRARAVLARKQSSLQALRDVVKANEIRVKAGDAGLLELRQSRVEAERFAVDVNSATADAQAGWLNLSGPLGKRFTDLFGGAAELDCAAPRDDVPADVEALVAQALDARRDVRAAQAAVANARDNVDLARANRYVDPVVNVGLTNTPRINPVVDGGGNVNNTPAQRSLTLGLTVSVPIPFSRLQDGELRQAGSALTQAELQLQSTVLKAETDVRAVNAQYRAAALNARSYADHVHQDSDKVLEGMRLSYRKGASSLLELLNAQRTADDVYLGGLQAQADLANAKVRLQLSSGSRPSL